MQMSFNSTISSISYTLGNSRANWEEQRDAVRKLKSLCSQYGNMFKANYIDINIKLGLIRCVGDNRSGLVTEACSAIIDLCNTLGQSMESVASDIFLNIIEKTASGVGTISNAVSECCTSMVKCLYMEKVILNLDRYLQHRSDKVQITTATCLKLIVSYWPDAILRKHYQHITSLIENGIRAPRSEVRSFMRESQEIIRRKFSNLPEEIPAQKPSYNSSPRKIISPSSSTAIKPLQSSLRNSATPRGVELASKKTGIAPRSVETPKYKANLTSSTYLSSSTRTPSTPVSKTINSRLTSSTSVPSSAYTVNRTIPTSPSYHSIPRKATNLSTTPTRSIHGNETPEALARLDRELERVPIEQKSQYSLFQRVRIRGTDGKLHLATVQFVGRTRGTKKIMYGVLYQDNYGPEGNGTYYNRHYGTKDTIISEYVPESDILPYSPSTPNRSLTSSRIYSESMKEPIESIPVRYSKEEVEKYTVEKMKENSESMKQLVSMLQSLHNTENVEEARLLSNRMIEKLKVTVENSQGIIDRLQNGM